MLTCGKGVYRSLDKACW